MIFGVGELVFLFFFFINDFIYSFRRLKCNCSGITAITPYEQ